MTRTISRTCIMAMLSLGVTAYAQTTGQSPTQPASQAGSQRMEQGRQGGDRSQTEQQITLVGCIQREAEYRQANEGGRGGTMGTGIGVGNEFVLINASSGSGSQTAMSGSTGDTSGTATGSATAGTTGTTASGTASTTGSATGTTSGTGTSGTASGTTSGSGTTGSASGTSTTPGSTASHTQHSGMSMASGGTAYALTGDREKDLERYVGQRVEIIGRIEGGSNRGGYSSGGASGTSGAGMSGSGTSGSGTSGSGTAGSGTSGSGTSATGTTSGSAGSTTGSAGAETTTGTSATGSRTGSGSASVSAGAQGQGFGNLQQINVVSFRAIGGSCSGQ